MNNLIQRPKIIIVLFFLAFLILGLSIVGDYGVSMDEGNNRIDGFRNIHYIIEKNSEVLNYSNRFHGPFFSIFINLIEITFQYSDNPKTIFLVRHIAIFLIFFLSLLLFYKFLNLRFNNWKFALLGCLFLILSPRIFAHSFYNPKDAVFLSFCIFAVYSQYLFLTIRSRSTALMHAFFCALAITTRIMGIFIPAVTIILYLLISKNKNSNKKGDLFFYVVPVFLLTYIFWPVLWVNPFGELLSALIFSSKIPVESVVLFMGNHVSSQQLPWYYLPTWIAVTTPICFLFLFIIGFLSTVYKLIKETIQKNLYSVLVLCWLLIPLLAVVVLKPNLYSGYRHFLFIYPPLLMIAMEGLNALNTYFNTRENRGMWNFARFSLIAFIALNCISAGIFMIRNHPYQNVYFNSLAGKDYSVIKDRFEMDYWGLSYREGFQYLADNIQDSTIGIIVPDDTYLLGTSLLSKEKRARFTLCTGGKRYLLTNYLYRPKHPIPYKEIDLEKIGKLIHSINVDGVKILGVYQVNAKRNDKARCVSLVDYLDKKHLLGYR